MKRAKGTESPEPCVAVRGSLVLAVVAGFFVLLWHKASPPPPGEVFGFSSEGRPLYTPVVHPIGPGPTATAPDPVNPLPPRLARAWRPAMRLVPLPDWVRP